MPIQESIEDRLRLYGLYYDRKKGEYRRLKKPLKDLVGMGTLAQAFIAVVLQQPDQSRGARKPTSRRINRWSTTTKSIDFYAAAILIDRQVEAYLEAREKAGTMIANVVRDLRYYV